MDKEQTAVLFRVSKVAEKYEKGWHALYALFPYLPGTNDPATCSSYVHVGQHGSADYDHCIKTSRPATPKEYAELAAELKRIGYNLRIIQTVGNRRAAMKKRIANA